MKMTDGQKRSGKAGLWAWALYDWANQSYATVIQTFVFSAYFINRIAEDPERATTDWSLTIGATGFCVGICGPVLGAVVDRAGRRKPYVAGFSLLCVLGTGCMWWVTPEANDYGTALALLAVSAFGVQMAIIFYNAMLADIAPRREYGKWSGRAWALGYAGGVCCLAAVLFLFIHERALFDLDGDNARHVRISFPFVSAWFLVFMLPFVFLTPDRESFGISRRQAIREGMGRLRQSIVEVRKYSNIVRFLIARAFYMDGLATVFALGGVYAAGTFGMDESRILVFGITLNISAALGAWFFSGVDDRIGSRKTVLISLVGLTLFSTLILVAPGELHFWIFGTLLGVFVGPVQSSSRSYFSHLVPDPLRTQMFGVYALAAKSTSFGGPLLVAGLTAWLGSQRLALGVIPVFFLTGLLILRGVRRAGADNDS